MPSAEIVSYKDLVACFDNKFRVTHYPGVIAKTVRTDVPRSFVILQRRDSVVLLFAEYLHGFYPGGSDGGNQRSDTSDKKHNESYGG
jgi:hypothetical protein